MGAANFYFRNASRVFATLMAWEDEDGEYQYPDEWEFQELIDDFKAALKDRFGFVGKLEDDSDRNYYGHGIGYVVRDRKFVDVDIQVEVMIYLRSGYHDGACFDWDYRFYTDGRETDDIEGVLEDAMYYTECRGLMKANLKHLTTWLNRTLNEMTTEVEELFAQYSTPMDVIARFSNGETIYG